MLNAMKSEMHGHFIKTFEGKKQLLFF